MNTGAFGENFPYSNFHDLNMDWIVKIAKDFLDQYTGIQDTITNGLEGLDTRYNEITALLDQWYATHSEEIAEQLAQALASALTDFNTHADQKGQSVIASIPSDYTALSNKAESINTYSPFDSMLMLEWKNGAYDSGTGINPRTDYLTTEEIAVMPGTSIYLKLGSAVYNAIGFTWYDINHTFVSLENSINEHARTEFEITVPNNVFFFKVCISKSYAEDITPAMYNNSYIILNYDTTIFQSKYRDTVMPGYTHDGQGGYGYFGNGRSAIIHPLKFPFAVKVYTDSNHNLAYQTYSSENNSSETLLVASGWVQSFVMPANTFFCVLIGGANTETGESLVNYIFAIPYIDTSKVFAMALDGVTGKDGKLYNSVIDAIEKGHTYSYTGEKIALDGKGVEVENIGSVAQTGLVPQGLCIYNNELFQMYTGSKFSVYNLLDNTLSSVFTFDPNLSQTFHSNSACFGNKYSPSDQYPLLYTNAYLDGEGLEGVCIVQRIIKENDSYRCSYQQTIRIGFVNDPLWAGETPNPSTGVNGNFVVDTENNHLIAFTSQGQNRTRFFIFNIPEISGSDVKTLTTSDILDYFDTGYIAEPQDVCIHNGFIYMNAGVNYGDEQYLRMYAINIKGRSITSAIRLETIPLLNNEPEGIDYYNGSLLTTTVSGSLNKLSF